MGNSTDVLSCFVYSFADESFAVSISAAHRGLTRGFPAAERYGHRVSGGACCRGGVAILRWGPTGAGGR